MIRVRTRVYDDALARVHDACYSMYRDYFHDFLEQYYLVLHLILFYYLSPRSLE